MWISTANVLPLVLGWFFFGIFNVVSVEGAFEVEVLDGGMQHLYTGDNIEIGVVMTVIDNEDPDLVDMAIMNIPGGCCLREAHICNVPTVMHNVTETCNNNHGFMDIPAEQLAGFMCTEDEQMFQIDGHATIVCNGPLNEPLEDRRAMRGRLLTEDPQEYIYSAMFWQAFKCVEKAEGNDGGGANWILDWNQISLDAVVYDHNGADKPANNLTCTMGPPAAAYVLALVHLAMFDAYNSINTQYNEYLTLVTVDSQYQGNIYAKKAAVSQAAHDVLQHFYGELNGEEYLEDELAANLTNSLSQIPSNQNSARDAGIAVGQNVSSELLAKVGDFCAHADNDAYTFRDEVGQHMVDPLHAGQNVLGPQFANDTSPLCLSNLASFVTDGPLNETNIPIMMQTPEYAAALAQVAEIGGDGCVTNTSRTWEGTYLGVFYSYDASPGIGLPPVMMNELLRTVIRQNAIEDSEILRLLTLGNVAMADAGIVAWKTKYDYNLWRPINAIRRADEDGNSATNSLHDDTWTYLGALRSNPTAPSESNFSPPFPAYTSGHAAFCAAAVKTLINFFQSNVGGFTFTSKEWNGVTVDDMGNTRPEVSQQFQFLSTFSSQCAASRIFLGVHYDFDGIDGVEQGYAVADEIFKTHLAPLTDPTPSTTPAPDYVAEINGILTDPSANLVLLEPQGNNTLTVEGSTVIGNLIDNYASCPSSGP